MSSPTLPDFERTLRLSQGNLDAAELAECHGLLCGMLCRNRAIVPGDFMQNLAAMQLVANPGAALMAALHEILGFALWLPDDDEPLEERTLALAQWCSGFLAGLAAGGQLDALSAESREAIEDLQQIARAEISSSQPSAGEREAEEGAYAEIVEYVRVVALMMREDFRGPERDDPIH